MRTKPFVSHILQKNLRFVPEASCFCPKRWILGHIFCTYKPKPTIYIVLPNATHNDPHIVFDVVWMAKFLSKSLESVCVFFPQLDQFFLSNADEDCRLDPFGA